jgi:hypothetical protein
MRFASETYRSAQDDKDEGILMEMKLLRSNRSPMAYGVPTSDV